MRGSAPVIRITGSRKTPPATIIRGSLTRIIARPICPGATVAAVVISPCPTSSESARLIRSVGSNCWNSSISSSCVLAKLLELRGQQLLLRLQALEALRDFDFCFGVGLGHESRIVQTSFMPSGVFADFVELLLKFLTRHFEVVALGRFDSDICPREMSEHGAI